MDFDPDKEFEIISNLILKLKEISPYTTESIRDVFNRNFWLYENYRKMQFRSYDEAKDYFNNNFKILMLGFLIGFVLNGFCALVAILHGDIKLTFYKFEILNLKHSIWATK